MLLFYEGLVVTLPHTHKTTAYDTLVRHIFNNLYMHSNLASPIYI